LAHRVVVVRCADGRDLYGTGDGMRYGVMSNKRLGVCTALEDLLRKRDERPIFPAIFGHIAELCSQHSPKICSRPPTPSLRPPMRHTLLDIARKRYEHPSKAAICALSGFMITAFSVTSASTSSAGVTSNTGFQASAPAAAWR
jgi:hypothetical protein